MITNDVYIAQLLSNVLFSLAEALGWLLLALVLSLMWVSKRPSRD